MSGRPLVRVKEKNYFFRLSKYQEVVRQDIEDHPNFIQPDARRNEVLGRIRDGLNDVASSRSTEPWGVSMPGDEDHSVYVWIDALFNYITALGFGNKADMNFEERGAYWPASYHVIGKEILWFHSVVWPAVLMALDLKLPRCIYAHSFWISEGRKMSKSLGNFYTVKDLLGGDKREKMWRGESIRLMMLSTHYRQPLDFTRSGIHKAKRKLDRWYRLLGDVDFGKIDSSKEVLGALCDDINTPRAVAIMDALCNRIAVGTDRVLEARNE